MANYSRKRRTAQFIDERIFHPRKIEVLPVSGRAHRKPVQTSEETNLRKVKEKLHKTAVQKSPWSKRTTDKSRGLERRERGERGKVNDRRPFTHNVCSAIV